MFEGADESFIPEWISAEDRRKQRQSRVQFIKDMGINIVHVCCCCKRKLQTHWDSNFELNGRWMALDVNASEIFHVWVADPQRVLCNWCFGTGEWKKRGIKIKGD